MSECKVNYCNYIFSVNDNNDDGKTFEQFKEFQKNTFYSALLLPFYQYEYKAKNKPDKVINKVISDSLKKSNEVMKFV